MARRNEPISVYFTVVGQSQFPYDMLRYDRCFPATEPSSHKLRESHDDEPRTVRLESPNRERHWQPNIARWASQRWKVTKVTTYRPDQMDSETEQA